MMEIEQKQDTERPYRVLSLDGGGMRGIYTAAFLARLTDQFARIQGKTALDLGRGFDLITGTSTGAIVGVLSGASPGKRALRQLCIGYGAAAATYLLGLAFGATMS